MDLEKSLINRHGSSFKRRGGVNEADAHKKNLEGGGFDEVFSE